MGNITLLPGILPSIFPNENTTKSIQSLFVCNMRKVGLKINIMLKNDLCYCKKENYLKFPLLLQHTACSRKTDCKFGKTLICHKSLEENNQQIYACESKNLYIISSCRHGNVLLCFLPRLMLLKTPCMFDNRRRHRNSQLKNTLHL